MISKNLKYPLISLLLLMNLLAFTQPDIPWFLQGTWKMENREVYEHWDSLSNRHLKGLSYSLYEGQLKVTEYLNIQLLNDEIIYTAAVLGQNNGEVIDFRLTETSSHSIVFENPRHDYPQKIIYQKLADTMLMVILSGGTENGDSYRLIKVNEKISDSDTISSTIESENPDYDHLLAKKLGADDYGMKSYILVLLKTGTNQSTDKSIISSSFRGHLDNIGHLVREGKMTVAGPLGKNEKAYRGIFILNVETIEEAEQLLRTDPAVSDGFLDYELYKWYGSAALPVYLETSDRIWKVKP